VDLSSEDGLAREVQLKAETITAKPGWFGPAGGITRSIILSPVARRGDAQDACTGRLYHRRWSSGFLIHCQPAAKMLGSAQNEGQRSHHGHRLANGCGTGQTVACIGPQTWIEPMQCKPTSFPAFSVDASARTPERRCDDHESNMMYNSYAMRQAKESWQSPLPRFTFIECLMPPSSSRRSFDKSSREKMYEDYVQTCKANLQSKLAKQRSSAEPWPSRPCACWNAQPPHAATGILLVCELCSTVIVCMTTLTRDAKFLFSIFPERWKLSDSVGKEGSHLPDTTNESCILPHLACLHSHQAKSLVNLRLIMDDGNTTELIC
jgi:hypothetical protein